MIRKIGLLIYPDFQILDAAGPVAAFEIAGRLSGAVHELSLVSAAGGLVRSSSGVAMASARLRDAGRFDTLIVVGGEGSRQAMHCPETRAFLQAQARSARRMCSVCTGAFPLAAAGLLDGRGATTHWRRAEALARQFPAVSVQPDAIYVRDGAFWTSAGITAGIDLALALIAEDLGEALARRVAQDMVVFYRRPGGQSQFSALLDLGGGESRFAELLGWARRNLSEKLTVEALAEQAGLSPRQFSRAFLRSVGMSPARAVERLRLEAAREKVEHSEEPIERIAGKTGFRDPERMRRAFLRAFGQPPRAMRRLAREN
ncbi:GlxA family transcriptional regulator [Rhodoblastus sp.]|uniref:GlxA family transcriptional regulator n=1 Tax=Rhodoblastus sp. TaxID=1962975 RepID=UPI003F94A507